MNMTFYDSNGKEVQGTVDGNGNVTIDGKTYTRDQMPSSGYFDKAPGGQTGTQSQTQEVTFYDKSGQQVKGTVDGSGNVTINGTKYTKEQMKTSGYYDKAPDANAAAVTSATASAAANATATNTVGVQEGATFEKVNDWGNYYLNGHYVTQAGTVTFDGVTYFVSKIDDNSITLIPEQSGIPRFPNDKAVTYTAKEYADKFGDTTMRYQNPKQEEKPKEEEKKENKDVNEWTSRADDYKEVKNLANDYEHALGSKDNGNVENQDRAITDFESRYEQVGTIKEGEGISHHHHQTQTDEYTINGQHITYLPGQMVTLASNPSDVKEFVDLYNTYKSNNLLGDAYSHKDGEGWSVQEYISVFASTGKYSAQDLYETTKAISSENSTGKTMNFVDYSGPLFKGTKFESFLADNAGTDYASLKQQYEKEVDDLEKGFLETHELLEGMMGSGIDSSQFYTLQCILGKFEVTMGNIKNRLEPACDALNQLLFGYTDADPPAYEGAEGKGLLEQLKIGEEEIDGLEGKGNNGVAKAEVNQFDLEEKIKELEEAIANKDKEHVTVPSEQYEDVKDKDGKVTGRKLKNGDAIQAAKDTNEKVDAAIEELKKEKAEYEAKLTELLELIKKKRESLNNLLTKAMILFSFIENYNTTKTTYKSYVTAGSNGKNSQIYDWVHSGDVNNLINNHDAIIHAFEDYATMPVISNKSDYELGDVILYDDAHGYAYAVSEAFDPINGTLKVCCIDKNGNRVGTDITVWDQREIVPIVGAPTKEYTDYPVKVTFPETIPETTPKKPTPIPRTTTPSTTTPGTTTPATTTPATTTPATTTPSTTTPPETIPPIPVFTVPWTDIIYTGTPGGGDEPGGGGSYGPDSPRTGLDAIYGTGDSKQSATGLGALAGLAAGAAGLGLTGLIGDKDDEDEEEDSRTEFVEEGKSDVAIEAKPEQQDSEKPQMF